jgi:hypothetical protein
LSGHGDGEEYPRLETPSAEFSLRQSLRPSLIHDETIFILVGPELQLHIQFFGIRIFQRYGIGASAIEITSQLHLSGFRGEIPESNFFFFNARNRSKTD